MKNRTAMAALLASTFLTSTSTFAASGAPCYPPLEARAQAIVQEIEEATNLRGPLPPSNDAAEAVVLLTKRLTKQTPFGKCWYTSRFDCFKVQRAFVEVTNILPAKPVAEVKYTEAITGGPADLPTMIYSYCDTLRR